MEKVESDAHKDFLCDSKYIQKLERKRERERERETLGLLHFVITFRGSWHWFHQRRRLLR